MADLLYSVEDVFLKFGSFDIPEYQRGYKWSVNQVRQLLKDVEGFDGDMDNDHFYCLQNITLVEKIDSEKTRYNVVDGQQRLTTSLLILCFFGDFQKVKDTIKYKVRPESDLFLQSITSNEEGIMSNVLNSGDFKDFITLNDFEKYDFQDIYYMFNALKTMKEFFGDDAVRKKTFLKKFLTQTKFIVNSLEGIEEQKLFMNLNTGKVQLDGSDLIRAILITRVSRGINLDLNDTKSIVRTNEQRVRIGTELDDIGKWWSKKNVKQYYSSFISISLHKDETIDFDKDKKSINLLYILYLQSLGKKEIALNYFDDSMSNDIGTIKLYDKILALDRTLKDWYSNKNIYHYLGYIFSFSKTQFSEIWELWESSYDRKGFTDELLIKMKTIVFENDETKEILDKICFKEISMNSNDQTPEALESVSTDFVHDKEDWYSSQHLGKILILMDVIRHSQDDDRYKFLLGDYFKINNEDKEHIYPSTPKNIKELQDNEVTYQDLEQYFRNINCQNIFETTEEEWNSIEDSEKERQLNSWNEQIHKRTNINSIGNLVLLNLSINRAFKNDYYPEKRRQIISNTKNGKYIRKHTLSTFSKDYGESNDMNSWSLNDISVNAKNIREMIESFFKL